MQARLLKDSKEWLCILCSDGTIIDANKNNLNQLLTSFHKIEKLGGGEKRWDDYPEMYLYPGQEFACVTDNFRLVISDFSPFKTAFHMNNSATNLITAAEYACLQKKSVEQIKALCRNSRIPGAFKFGRDWAIPADAPYPTDNRYGPTKN